MGKTALLLLLWIGIGAKATAAFDMGEVMGSAMVRMNTIHLTPDTYPTFKGGDQALLKYIGKNNQAPLSPDGRKAKGKVAVKFIIEADGTIREAEVFRSSGKAEVDSAGIAFVKNMPRWNPGIEDAKPVRCLYILPIHFK